MIFVDLELLDEIVAPAEVLSAKRHCALEWLIVGVDRPYMPLQVLSSQKALATASHCASE